MKFAFIIHPIDPKADVARKYPLLSHMPVSWIDFFSRYFPPLCLSHIQDIESTQGARTEGWLLSCPFTPRSMQHVPLEKAYAKIARTAELGQRLGAEIVGLGAFTSVIGDAGYTLSQRLDVPLTTGNSYTIAVVLETLQAAAQQVGIDIRQATIGILGATGAIGRACTHYAARHTQRIVAIGRDTFKLEQLAQEMVAQGLPTPHTTTEIGALNQANLIIAAASHDGPLIKTEHVNAGTVICDVALPKSVDAAIDATRPDVLVIDGGVVRLPGTPKMGFHFGLGQGLVYACMAETMLLALEGHAQDFTIGRDIRLEQVAMITQLATKHGFHVDGLRFRGQPISQDRIAQVREHIASNTGSFQDLETEEVKA